jgi:hypothetical protein
MANSIIKAGKYYKSNNKVSYIAPNCEIKAYSRVGCTHHFVALHKMDKESGTLIWECCKCGQEVISS